LAAFRPAACDSLFLQGMKSKTLRKDKVSIITLGCSKNLVDSEVLSGQLRANDIDVVHESPVFDHNIVIVNTCGFIDKAKEESIQTILEQVELKRKGKLEKVYVTGCLSERYKQNLEAEIPEVDAYFGTVEEARRLVKSGVKEIMLIAQELTYYGLDLYKRRTLPDLLNALADIDGLHWIRLHYAYPSKFPLEIIDVMRDRPNICNYLDMPLQHASNAMLKAMKRQITREEMEELIGEIRSRIPEICLRTTLIAGFPGETREDVEELKDFLARQRFDRLGVFTYSHEEDTSAHGLEDLLSQEEKEARAQEIMDFQQDISLEKNMEKVGRVMKVLVDRKEAGRYLGRTEFDSVEVDNEVIIQTRQKLNPGDFVDVSITKAYDYDLEGEIWSI
jgi:tRNA A37 methylthiotransferase MiaB